MEIYGYKPSSWSRENSNQGGRHERGGRNFHCGFPDIRRRLRRRADFCKRKSGCGRESSTWNAFTGGVHESTHLFENFKNRCVDAFGMRDSNESRRVEIERQKWSSEKNDPNNF